MFLILKVFQILFYFQFLICDNIDTEFPIIFSFQKSDSNSRDNENINGSYFGYSLIVNQQNDDNHILIGAPKYDSRLYSRAQRSGSIFHCKWNEKKPQNDVICGEIDFRPVDRFLATKNMNLGSSLSSITDTFVGCGHLYVTDRPPITPIGKCFQIKIDTTNQISRQNFGPSKPNIMITDDGRPYNSHLMYGFSSFGIQSEESFLIGGPGYLDFMGTIVRRYLETPNSEEKLFLEQVLRKSDPKFPKINEYLGYSITTGFFDSKSEYVVMSAPRANSFNGRVLIYPLEDLYKRRGNNFGEYLFEERGESDAFGEYFGASLLAIDINNDKFDDLIVGAPLYSNKLFTEIGRIYIYLTNDKGTELKRPEFIIGHKSNSRFGTALSAADINLDDFYDVIVGAPQETNSDGSLGAVYIYFGSAKGLESNAPRRIGAENLKNVVFNGFGVSVVSSVDFDFNGYNDIMIGSYLSENAVLLRSKPIANISITNIGFKPNKIRLTDKKCNTNQNSCFKVEFCVNYEGKHIRNRQSAIITLEITDSKLRVRENRVKFLNNSLKSEQKVVNLIANQPNCVTNDNSFVLFLNDDLFDIITPIELKLTVELRNQSSDKFCKECPIASSYTSFAYNDFEYGCQKTSCLSRLTLNAISKYSDQKIEKNLIEGLHDTIDIEITVSNSGEASINTYVIINMTPVLLDLANSGEADRCVPMMNVSSYRCEVNKVLQKNRKESLNLHFTVSRIPSNHLNIDLKLESSSTIEAGSKSTDSMKFEIIRQANLVINNEQTKSFSYSDKIRRVPFQVHYNLLKSGPSTIDLASLVLQLPTDVIDIDGESQNLCEILSKGKRTNFPIVSKTLDLNCDKRLDYCTKYLCRLPKLNSGGYSQPFSLSLALIPSIIEKLVFKGINFTLKSELKIDDKIRFETEIKSIAEMTLFLDREVIDDAKVEPWILFVSSGVGLFLLIIAIIILIKIGFFKRKKLEEIEKVKLRMSMRPDMYDINIEDMTEQELNEMEN